MSQNRIETLPRPFARHGVGPSSENLSRMLSTSSAEDFSDSAAEISTMKWNGENWNSASKPRWPST